MTPPKRRFRLRKLTAAFGAALSLQSCYSHNGSVYNLWTEPPQSHTQPELEEERADSQVWSDPTISTQSSGSEQNPPIFSHRPSDSPTHSKAQPSSHLQPRSKPGHTSAHKDKYLTAVCAGPKGENIVFYQDENGWRARVAYDLPGGNTQVKELPVFAKVGVDIASYLNALSQQPASVQSRRIGILSTKQGAEEGQCVYLGKQGLQGGVDTFSIDGSRVRGDSTSVRMTDVHAMLTQILGSNGASNFCDSVHTIFLLLDADDGPVYRDTFAELLNDLWNPLQANPALYAAIPLYLERLNDIPYSKRPQVIANIVARFLKSAGKLGTGSIKLSKTSCASLCEALQGFATTMGNMNPVDAQVSRALIEEALLDVSNMEMAELVREEEVEARRQAEIREREREIEARELAELAERQKAEEKKWAELERKRAEAKKKAEWKRQQEQAKQQIQWEKQNESLENRLTTWDPITDTRINTLDMRIQGLSRKFINLTEAKFGVQLRVTDATRSVEEQDKLYAIGRFGDTRKKVTNAIGGKSYHNYGLAFDVVIMENKKCVWSKLPDHIVQLALDLGFEWGGHWIKFKDYPHFQMPLGYSLKELKDIYEKNKKS